MIDHTAARAGLHQILSAALPDVRVQASGLDALASFPSVIIGQPAWSPSDQLPYGIDRTTWPVAVVVARSSSDTTTIDQLERLWPQVLAELKAAAEADQTLGGICVQSLLTRADFGQFSVQGKDYPAQLVFCELYG